MSRVRIGDRINETRTMNCGKDAKIINYNNSHDIEVMFLETKEIIKTTYDSFSRGTIKSHLTPTVYNVGITGNIDKYEYDKYSYKLWVNVLTRCYNENYKKTRPTYKDVAICEEWKYYLNFKEWFVENYYELKNERVELDKDILDKGNKIYSPEKCVFVPQRINSLFTNCKSRRGDLPLGVTKIAKGNYLGYISTVSINGKNTTRSFKNIEDAFYDYKFRKEQEIKRLAEEYKGVIPIELYEALYNYKIEITD